MDILSFLLVVLLSEHTSLPADIFSQLQPMHHLILFAGLYLQSDTHHLCSTGKLNREGKTSLQFGYDAFQLSTN